MSAESASIARAQVIDWSQAPSGADGWARERGRCFWWRKPATGELCPVRLEDAPDLMPWDSADKVHAPIGWQS